MIDLGRSCSRHRPALVDFVDHGEVRGDTSAALAHLDRCDRCLEAIESTVLTITALRRYAATLDAVEPSADAWPRLAERITTWRRRSFTTSPLAGLAMSLAIVAVVVLPFRLGPDQLGAGSGSSNPVASAPRSVGPGLSTQPDAVRVGPRRPVADEVTSSLDRKVIRREVVSDDVVVTTKEVADTRLISPLGWRI